MTSNTTLDAPVSGERGSKGSEAEARTRSDKIARAIRRLRRSRAELESNLAEFPQLASAVRALRRIEVRLERPLRVAIAGEFNSGKTSLANLLVGIDSLPTAVVSNTRFPTLLYYAATPEIYSVEPDGRRTLIVADRPACGLSPMRLEVGLPSTRLKTAELLDMPGLADPQFEGSPSDLAPHNVDAVIWCTVATQAWKESERRACGQLAPRLRGRSLLAVTHRDLLADDRDEAKLLARLRGVAGHIFRDIVMVSSVDDPQMNMETLQQALEDLLEDVNEERIKAALQVISRIAKQTLSRVDLVPALVAAE